MGIDEKYIKKGMDDRSLLEHIAMFVPGYRGYRERNLRRDMDQLIRKEVFSMMKLGIKDLEWAYRESVNFSGSNRVDELNRIAMKADKVSQSIYHAKHGYTGVWQAIKVREGELSGLLEYDAGLIDQANMMRSASAGIRENARKHNFDLMFDAVDQYDVDLDQVIELISDRDRVILGFQKDGEHNEGH